MRGAQLAVRDEKLQGSSNSEASADLSYFGVSVSVEQLHEMIGIVAASYTGHISIA